MEINRDYYLQELIDRIDNGLIKIITGIRRCGKSYLLNTIFKNYLISQGTDKEHIIQLSLDERTNFKYLEYIHYHLQNFIQYKKAQKKKH